MQNKENMTVWDVFNEYADIRDELEDAMHSFSSAIEDIQFALMDLNDEMNQIYDHLSECDKIFRRFRSRNPRYFEPELPFD